MTFSPERNEMRRSNHLKYVFMALSTLIALLLIKTTVYAATGYTWLPNYAAASSIAKRIAAPEGFERIETRSGSFEDWLRHLPLKKGRPPVHLYNGVKKENQYAHHAIIDIDVGKEDLQQCADAVIRLRAEYFFSTGELDKIKFRFTSGHVAEYKKWMEGYRPVVLGNVVKWVKTAKKDPSYSNFRNGYLNKVFTYAGSASLAAELKKVNDVSRIKIGDVFIQGGHPGHAVIVVDMAADKITGKKIFLIAQSFMPAQEMHILKNPGDSRLSPWYELDFGEELETPNWTFKKNDLKRF